MSRSPSGIGILPHGRVLCEGAEADGGGPSICCGRSKAGKAGGLQTGPQFVITSRWWRESEAELTMHLTTKRARRCFVDYPGRKFMVYDPTERRGAEVETLVAILGASQLTYAEATETPAEGKTI